MVVLNSLLIGWRRLLGLPELLELQQLAGMLLGGFGIEEHSQQQLLEDFDGERRRYGDLDSKMQRSDWVPHSVLVFGLYLESEKRLKTDYDWLNSFSVSKYPLVEYQDVQNRIQI